MRDYEPFVPMETPRTSITAKLDLLTSQSPFTDHTPLNDIEHSSVYLVEITMYQSCHSTKGIS